MVNRMACGCVSVQLFGATAANCGASSMCHHIGLGDWPGRVTAHHSVKELGITPKAFLPRGDSFHSAAKPSKTSLSRSMPLPGQVIDDVERSGPTRRGKLAVAEVNVQRWSKLSSRAKWRLHDWRLKILPFEKPPIGDPAPAPALHPFKLPNRRLKWSFLRSRRRRLRPSSRRRKATSLPSGAPVSSARNPCDLTEGFFFYAAPRSE